MELHDIPCFAMRLPTPAHARACPRPRLSLVAAASWPPPQDEAHAIITRRFPTPRFTDCDQNGSQARFLLAKLNPSATYNTSSSMSSEIIMTDDVSLQVGAEGGDASGGTQRGRPTARLRGRCAITRASGLRPSRVASRGPAHHAGQPCM